MKISEIKQLQAEELDAKVAETKAAIAEIKFKLASKVDVEKPGSVRQMRRDIARMLTVKKLSAREAK